MKTFAGVLLSFLIFLTTAVRADNKSIFYLPKSSSTQKINNIVVMLHGCHTTAEEFAGGTRMKEWADRLNFAVFFPAQSEIINSSLCWNWFYPLNQMQGLFSEATKIMRSVHEIQIRHQLINAKIFVAGMSAGGAMSAILASCFSSEIAGAAIHSGLSYQAANDVDSAYYAMANGALLDSKISAANAYACSFFSRHSTRVMVIHGESDDRVVLVNSEQTANHFLGLYDLIDDGIFNASVSKKPNNVVQMPSLNGKYPYQYSDYNSGSETLLRLVKIKTLKHCWSGGNDQYLYNDSMGPDASKMMLEFFGILK